MTRAVYFAASFLCSCPSSRRAGGSRQQGRPVSRDPVRCGQSARDRRTGRRSLRYVDRASRSRPRRPRGATARRGATPRTKSNRRASISGVSTGARPQTASRGRSWTWRSRATLRTTRSPRHSPRTERRKPRSSPRRATRGPRRSASSAPVAQARDRGLERGITSVFWSPDDQWVLVIGDGYESFSLVAGVARVDVLDAGAGKKLPAILSRSSKRPASRPRTRARRRRRARTARSSLRRDSRTTRRKSRRRSAFPRRR